MENKNQIIEYKKEIANLVSNQQVFQNLIDITFKGLTKEKALQAMLEGRMTGFTLQNFLQKDVYAIPFGNNYSLVTSIGYGRKIGQKSGIVATSAPIYDYEEDGKTIKSCTITIKKKTEEYIGDYENKVFFKEYTTNKNLWVTKPHTMIAKVAEAGALRKACPEELKNYYLEEEMEKEKVIVSGGKTDEEINEEKKEWKKEMDKCKDINELQNIWVNVPAALKNEKVVIEYKNKLKEQFLKQQEAIDGNIIE